MNLKNTLAVAAAALSLLGAVGGAFAAPITYTFTGGQATLSLISAAGNLLQPGSTIALTGTQVTFDAAIPELTSFSFDKAGTGNLLGAGLLAGTTLSITNFNVVPGAGYVNNSTTGTNPYFYNVGPVNVSGTYGLSGAITQLPVLFSTINSFLTGQINTSLGTLQLNGITLGSFTLPTGIASLKADVLFTGVVPVPAAALLFGSALAGLPLLRRRKAA